jgi:DNA-binding NarL/FixJ family response regulator
LAEAFGAGARGVVLKKASLSDLVRAVETVVRGETYVDPAVERAR